MAFKSVFNLVNLALVLAATTAVFGAPATDAEASVEVERTREGKVLLRFADDEEPTWYTEVEKLDFMAKDIKFMDVTETWEGHEERLAKVQALQSNLRRAYPPISRRTTVQSVASRLSTSNLQSYLATLTAFNNRYYRATTGAQASTSIRNTVQGIISGRSDASVAFFNHSFVQPSVILKFAGTEPTAPITILGAHLDSTAGSATARAPGADDDGSGTVTLIEALRALVASGFTPRTPLEFQWYAGEEAGLLGSQAIAANYANAGKTVNAMLQFDMTAYTRPGNAEVIGLITDRTNAALNTYLRTLIGAYNAIPYVNTTCGYGCSDHAAWTSQGYPSAFPFEATLSTSNPQIHTSGDTINVSGFSWNHMLEFAKLAVAAVVELTS